MGRSTWTMQLARIGSKGAEARRQGLGRDACPYKEGYRNANGPGGSVQSQRRKAWLEGWESVEAPIRAHSYIQHVARGTCPSCKRVLDLRFCWNPHGDDDLLCDDCAEQREAFYAEHSKNNR